VADIVGYFPATAAVDGASGARLRYAEAQVYAWADTNYSTPLAITDLQGIPMVENKLIAVDGVYPDFRPPADVLQVRAKSGSFVTPMTSLTVFAQAAQDGAKRAEQAALEVSQDVDEAAAVAQVLRTLAEKQGAPLIEDPLEPGTFTIFNTASIREDPAEPGTFLMGANA